MSRRARVRAFTLIEILVVVAIIALLVAILLPSLAKAREQTRMVLCKSNMKQIMLGTLTYTTEFKVLPGSESVYYESWINWGRATWPLPPRDPDPKKLLCVWDGAIRGYSGSGGRNDPEFIADVPQRGSIFRYTRDRKLYVCPSDKMGVATDTPLGGGGNGRISFSMNAYIGFKRPDQMSRPANASGWTMQGNGKDGKPVPTPQKNAITWTPAQMFILVEEHPFQHKNTNCEGNFNVDDAMVARHNIIQAPKGTKLGLGRTNLAYVDGHVESPLYATRTTADDLFAQIGFPARDKAFRTLFVTVAEPP